MHSLTTPFFLKRKVKILINYTNIFKRNKSNFPDTHESNWLSTAKGKISINVMPKELGVSKYRPPDGRFYPPYTIVLTCTSECGMKVNKS